MWSWAAAAVLSFCAPLVIVVAVDFVVLLKRRFTFGRTSWSYGGRDVWRKRLVDSAGDSPQFLSYRHHSLPIRRPGQTAQLLDVVTQQHRDMNSNVYTVISRQSKSRNSETPHFTADPGARINAGNANAGRQGVRNGEGRDPRGTEGRGQISSSFSWRPRMNIIGKIGQWQIETLEIHRAPLVHWSIDFAPAAIGWWKKTGCTLRQVWRKLDRFTAINAVRLQATNSWQTAFPTASIAFSVCGMRTVGIA